MRFVPPVFALCALALSACSQDVEISDKLNRPPTVAISNPLDDSEFSELDQIDFIGVVDDADGLTDIASLEWRSDQVEEPLATLDDAPPDAQGFTQFASSLGEGTHAITLTAVDSTGLQSVASISLVITPALVQPTAEILVPVPGATYNPGEYIQLAGSANDPNTSPDTLVATWSYSPAGGGAREVIWEAPVTSGGSASFTWTDAPIGDHVLVLTVTDPDGNFDEQSQALIVLDPNEGDEDHDGFTILGGDCDDTDDDRRPGLDEWCDGKDNDCNSIVDDKDLDNDDHIDEFCVLYTAGGYPVDDCEDDDGTIFPGAAEQSDGLDNDCNGVPDDGLDVFDNDGDCFCTAPTCSGGSTNAACVVVDPGDCDDSDPALHDRDDDGDGASPCDGDCDDTDGTLNDLDVDLDQLTTCEGDCNDFDPTVSNADNDNDGASTCEGDCNDNNALLNILDADNDGASSCAGDCNDGNSGQNLLDIDGDGFTSCAGDCNDADGTLTPLDNDFDGASSCDGDCDDADPTQSLNDGDLDGYSTCGGDCDDTTVVLNPADIDADGTSSCSGDCNDLVASLNINDADLDGVSTCAGDCDDADALLNLNDFDLDGFSTCTGDCNDFLWGQSPADLDGDGFSTCDDDCDDADPVLNPADQDTDGITSCDGDCDDLSFTVYPGGVEIAYNGVDDDCLGGDLVDADGDGHDADVVGGDDCDDTDPSRHPSAAEYCNGFDDDCDNATDEANAIGCTVYYLDSDGDGYGSGVFGVCQCDPGDFANYDAPDNDDCYDANPDAHPGQTQSFFDDRGDNSWDYDCDGIEEEDDTRVTNYTCSPGTFPFDFNCTWTNGWEDDAPECGETENWGTGCFYVPFISCEPLNRDPVDQSCK